MVVRAHLEKYWRQYFVVISVLTIGYFDVQDACMWAMGITFGWTAFKNK